VLGGVEEQPQDVGRQPSAAHFAGVEQSGLLGDPELGQRRRKGGVPPIQQRPAGRERVGHGAFPLELGTLPWGELFPAGISQEPVGAPGQVP
jgi:hypothetical protein